MFFPAPGARIAALRTPRRRFQMLSERHRARRYIFAAGIRGTDLTYALPRSGTPSLIISLVKLP